MTKPRERIALQAGVAVMVLLMQGLALAALMEFEIPAANTQAFSLMVGAILNASGMVVAYFFGSSQAADRNSEHKTASASDNSTEG